MSNVILKIYKKEQITVRLETNILAMIDEISRKTDLKTN